MATRYIFELGLLPQRERSASWRTYGSRCRTRHRQGTSRREALRIRKRPARRARARRKATTSCCARCAWYPTNWEREWCLHHVCSRAGPAPGHVPDSLWDVPPVSAGARAQAARGKGGCSSWGRAALGAVVLASETLLEAWSGGCRRRDAVGCHCGSWGRAGA